MAWTSRRLVVLPAIGAFAAAGLGAPGAARADGDDRALSMTLGFSTFSEPGKPTTSGAATTVSPDGGVAVSGIYEHAISTDVSLRGELGFGSFFGGQSPSAMTTGAVSYAALADVGLTFRFDVLKYVPYAFGAVGPVYSTGGPLDQGWQPVLVLGGGLDVLENRARSWGVEARLTGFMSDVTTFTIGLRGTIRWGYL